MTVIKSIKPAVHTGSAPGIHHYFARGNGYIFRCGIGFLTVNEPHYLILMPLKGIIVKILGSVKAKVIKILVISLAVGEIIELHL